MSNPTARLRYRLPRLRDLRGISARELAERCTALGWPIGRSIISKLETGARQGVELCEAEVLATALGVDPPHRLWDAAPLTVSLAIDSGLYEDDPHDGGPVEIDRR